MDKKKDVSFKKDKLGKKVINVKVRKLDKIETTFIRFEPEGPTLG